MTTGTLTVKHGDGTTENLGEFALEPPIEPGHVPARVVDELRTAYRIAKDYTGAFGDAVKAQAKKHQIAPAALRKYVAALECDSIGDAAKEAEDLARLIVDAGATERGTTSDELLRPGIDSVSMEFGSDSAFADAVKASLIEKGATVKPDGSLDVSKALGKRKARA